MIFSLYNTRNHGPKLLWADFATGSFSHGPILFVCVEVYGPVNPMGSCGAQSVYLTTRLLGRLSPKPLTSTVQILSPETDNCPSILLWAEMTPNHIIYSIPKTSTITWFICFNQCMGLFFLTKKYTFIYLVYLFSFFFFCLYIFMVEW